METRFRPVLSGRGRCVGHIIASARGWRAYDRRDALLGYYATESEAADALIARSGAEGSHDG
jgi:hypothetical protein